MGVRVLGVCVCVLDCSSVLCCAAILVLSVLVEWSFILL